MRQMTVRASEDLLERVRHAARDQHVSVNEYVGQVLDAATNPDFAGTDAERTRERLIAAGLLERVERIDGRRPDPDCVADARAAAATGTALAEIVSADRV